MVDSIRKRILTRRGVEPAKYTRNIKQYFESDAPFLKTPTMRLLEMKYGVRIEALLLNGTIDELAKKLSIDRSTVSKWRKRIRLSGQVIGKPGK
jgi:transposase-like protein